MFNPDRLNLSLYFKSLSIVALFVFLQFNSNFKAFRRPYHNVYNSITSHISNIISLGVLGFWGSESGSNSRFVGAKNFFSSLSGMTDTGSMNDDEYCEQDFNDETNQVTR